MSIDLTKDFHVYSLIWTPTRMDFLMDSQVFHSETLQRSFNNAKAGVSPYKEDGQPFDQYFYLIINLAVGGNFFGPSESQALTAQQAKAWASPRYVLDYVRVYQLPTGASSSAASSNAPATTATPAPASIDRCDSGFCPSSLCSCDGICYIPRTHSCVNGSVVKK